jgi:hypothetical protein
VKDAAFPVADATGRLNEDNILKFKGHRFLVVTPTFPPSKRLKRLINKSK